MPPILIGASRCVAWEFPQRVGLVGKRRLAVGPADRRLRAAADGIEHFFGDAGTEADLFERMPPSVVRLRLRIGNANDLADPSGKMLACLLGA